MGRNSKSGSPRIITRRGPGKPSAVSPTKTPSQPTHMSSGESVTLYGIRAGRQRTGCPLSSVTPMALLPRAGHFRVQQAPPVVTSRPFGQGRRTGGDWDPTSGW